MTHAIVIGGGFYGCALACYLSKRGRAVTLLEAETELLTRASYNNQARVHNGYHYPRDLTTAIRSRVNLPRFCHDHEDAIERRFTKVYAIARSGSKVSARQFVRFCREIGAEIQQAPEPIARLFDRAWVEDVFLVKEYAFDALVLRKLSWEQLRAAAVEVRTGCRVVSLQEGGAGLELTMQDGTMRSAAEVYNCTYAGLNQLEGDKARLATGLKHEVTELALVEVPEELTGLGVTVMDGPFFSCMPFPARRLHSLSHVRYTPQFSWLDEYGRSPEMELRRLRGVSRAEQMIRDAGRFLPAMRSCRHIDSLFEVKTVLVKNEENDGRPILLERSRRLPGLISVLGGKIDNIYDVIASLEAAALKGEA